jgi:hypothetical protein
MYPPVMIKGAADHSLSDVDQPSDFIAQYRLDHLCRGFCA